MAYNIKVRIGKNIKALRERRKLSQVTLAKRVGVTQPYVVALEKGRENPTLTTLTKLAKALKVTLGDLVE
ncbi:MAG: helix-turn-helix transcriptional regulator [Nitrospira sp.]|nr:helix-turn-helix transcriptional regulator [Nitrospira sp.]